MSDVSWSISSIVWMRMMIWSTLSSVVWMMRVMRTMMWMAVDHVIGVSTGSHRLIERDGHTNGTDSDE